MPLQPMKGFLAGSYELAGVAASCQQTLNLIPEIIESDGEPQIGYLRGRAGLGTPVTIGSGPIRGMCQAGTPLFPLSGTGATWFVVSGQYLYQLSNLGVIIAGSGPGGSRGSVDQTGGPYTSPATLLPNGNQLAIQCGGVLWIDEGSGPSPISFAADSFTDLAAGWSGIANTDASGRVQYVSGIPWNKGMVGGSITLAGYSTYTIVGLDVFGGIPTLGCTLGASPPPSLSGVAFTAGPAAANVVSSQLTPFTQGDVLAQLVFNGPAPWVGTVVPVTLTVHSVDAYGNATLYNSGNTAASSPAVNGSTGGVVTEQFQPFAVSSLAFLDSFYIASIANSKTFQVSAPLDGTTWDPTDEATKESYPDNIGKILADHQELLVLGETHSEVWQAPGANPIFPFSPNESYALAVGVAAPESACSLRDGPVWIGASLRGQPIAYFAQGFVPQRISTHAVEQVWAGYLLAGSIISDAQAFSYELDGHELWQINFPTADATWVYDRTASVQLGKSVWHEENSYTGSAYHRHRAMSHVYVFDQHWVGDFANGNIYPLSSNVFTDNGQPIKCVRTFPHINAARLRQFFLKLQLDIQTTSAALTIVVTWSDDGGVTWVGGGSDFTYVTSDYPHPNLERVAFFQLGSADNRVFSIQVTGTARKVLNNAYIDVLTGIS